MTERATERAVEITQTYSPAPGRTVIVDGIPATEVTLGDATETMINFTVRERVQSLIRCALETTDDHVQHLAYTAAPDAHSVSSGERIR
jgi:hypothetical protein